MIKSSEIKSPSIKSVLKSNKKDKSIKKKEPNRVRKIIMDLENPKIIHKSKSTVTVTCQKKSSLISHNQAKITSYLGSIESDEAVKK